MSIGSFLPMLFHDPPRVRIAPNPVRHAEDASSDSGLIVPRPAILVHEKG
jgi:hypothetical protein